MWCRFAPKKTYTEITPLAKECFNYFVRELGLTGLDKIVGFSDNGHEFNFKLYEKWGLRLRQLPRASLIENKNAQFQSALYRIAKLNISKSIDELIKRALKIVNRTKSRLTKKAPFENAKEENADLSTKYNKKRGKGSGLKVKMRPLKIGEMVRVNKVGAKKDSFYKTYKGQTWTKKRFKVLAKRGNRYKIDHGDARSYKNEPKGKVFHHRDDLRLTVESDNQTALVLRKRGRKLK